MLYLYDLWHFVQMPKIIEIREELYMADMWDEIYFDAKRLFGNATGYENINSKAKTLKLAANELILLPDWYPGKEELLEKINQYARCCDVNLIAIMCNTVNDSISKRTCFTSKLIVPFFEYILRTEDS